MYNRQFNIKQKKELKVWQILLTVGIFVMIVVVYRGLENLEENTTITPLTQNQENQQEEVQKQEGTEISDGEEKKEVSQLEVGEEKEEASPSTNSKKSLENSQNAFEDFMMARLQKDQENAESYLSDKARSQFAGVELNLVKTTSPFFVKYEYQTLNSLNEQTTFLAKIYQGENYQEPQGYFEETLVMIEDGEDYKIDSVSKGDYVNL